MIVNIKQLICCAVESDSHLRRCERVLVHTSVRAWGCGERRPSEPIANRGIGVWGDWYRRLVSATDHPGSYRMCAGCVASGKVATALRCIVILLCFVTMCCRVLHCVASVCFGCVSISLHYVACVQTVNYMTRRTGRTAMSSTHRHRAQHPM